MLTNIEVQKLENLCHDFRLDLVHTLYRAQTGHPGGSLSCCELITVLYQCFISNEPDRNRFILSKGHAAPMLYLNLIEKGWIAREELENFRQLGSVLQGHPCMHKIPGVDLSTGPLGIGLGAACGMACADKMDGNDRKTYILLGDGELQEGVVWEALMSASKFQLSNLVIIVDNNHVQLDGTNDEIMPMGDLQAKMASFGCAIQVCDGHDVNKVHNAILNASSASEKPQVILAQTVKGKGISFMEGKSQWHGAPLSSSDYQQAIEELGEKMHE